MSVLDYLKSDFACTAIFVVLFFFPALCLQRRISFGWVFSLLAICGAYTFLAYLKPAALPVWTISIPVLLISVWSWFRVTPQAHEDTPFLNRYDLVLLILCFSVFLFRWEPPGSDPVKWGSLAKLFLFHGTIPGDTRPLSPNPHLTGATMGVPILLALVHSTTGMAMERIISFFSCFSLAVFFLSLAGTLRIWFDRAASSLAALFCYLLFTNPQQFIAWGGTPTLLGYTFGFLLIRLFAEAKDRKIEWLEKLAWGLALAFAAYAHPIGTYLSLWVSLPFLVVLSLHEKKIVLNQATQVGFLTFLFFVPFLISTHFGASANEMREVYEWQKQMAPTLFREGHWPITNFYHQWSNYLWSTSAVPAFVLFLFFIFKFKSRRIAVAAFSSFALIGLLLCNVWHWFLPLSYLIYPERAAALTVILFGFGLAWLIERRFFDRKRGTRIAVGIFLLLGLLNYGQRTLPLLGKSQLIGTDREVIRELANHVSPTDCVRIHFDGPGKWIPVLAFRCTFPYHVLGLNSVDIEKERSAATLRWQFISEAETIEIKGETRLSHGRSRLVELPATP